MSASTRLAQPRSAYAQPWFVLNSSRYAVTASTHPAVAHFYAFDVAHTAEALVAVPDGCVDIIFDCDATAPTARICGTPLQAQPVTMQRNHHYFGVRFTPGVIPGFINVLAEELTEHELDLLEATPFARGIFERIVQSQALGEQISLFTDHLAPSLMGRTSQVTAMVIEKALQRRGDIRVQELEALSGYTSRTIHRLFSQDTGMSPKTFCRIIRCQAALDALGAVRETAYCDLALELGFTDQSHFLRDFKRLVSATPHEYRRRVEGEGYAGRITFG
ncbi:helix-turn-helix domain-containing protein [Pseudomonas sp. RIT-To-2]|uniref:helix-turn-helix domain-containing protein n=1 Tax=Pseudomonas sp. RIT-To-2 TaxID=3462541 RepID=UPI00241378C7